MSKNIMVIFGGRSNENEISIITGCMIANVLKKAGKNVVLVYVSQQGDFYTGEKLADLEYFKSGDFTGCDSAIFEKGGIYALTKRKKLKNFIKIDAAVNCCHGGDGEGGGVSGMLNMYQIPCASAGVFESSVFMDKYLTKLILEPLGVKTAPYVYVKKGENAVIEQYPAIIKPCKLGSSIGIEVVNNEKELSAALETAFEYDDGVIIEKFLPDKREINCAAYLGDELCISDCEEVFSDKVYSYDDKYSGGAKNKIPANLPPDTARLIKETTKKVYEKLNMRGIIRIDYIISGGEVYLSEVNTVPGSLSYYLLSQNLKSFSAVLEKAIDRAVKDFKILQSKTVLNTGILNNFSSNACKSCRK